MARGGIETWGELARASGVSDTTIDNWIYGVTTPRAHHLAKVGKALSPYTTPGDLERAYQGLEPEEPPLVDLLKEIVPELHELVILLRAQAGEAVLEAVRDALEEARLRRAGELALPTDTPLPKVHAIDRPFVSRDDPAFEPPEKRDESSSP